VTDLKEALAALGIIDDGIGPQASAEQVNAADRLEGARLVNGIALDRLREQLAEARSLAGVALAMAEREDVMESDARADGAFEAAVIHQTWAANLRGGRVNWLIRGAECRTLIADVSNGLVRLRGDAIEDPAAIALITGALCDLSSELVAACATAEKKEADRG
jgi:hypothetical protein